MSIDDQVIAPVANPLSISNSQPEATLNRYRQYRAPQNHGDALIDPPLGEVDDWLTCNAALSASHGPFWDSLRQRARASLIDDAIRYTSAYRDTSWVDRQALDRGTLGPILMAGHQPAIFHPGVWFKNFALDHLARRCGGIGINLVIDNDVASGSSVRVPSLNHSNRKSPGQPTEGEVHYEVVPYDDAGGGVPYEQTTVRRRDIFDRFDVAVTEAVAGIVDDPCVGKLWKHAKSAIERCGVAGCALAQARHGLEGELGLRTLELPLGVVCRTTAYAEFLLSILTELPRFHHCYNDSADQYRSAHGIRSSAHPVPNLAVDDEWFEAPLWIYGNDSPERRPAWVRLSGDQLIISDRMGREGVRDRELRIDVRHPKLAAEQLANLVSPNFKLRPRALVTTMYARMVLSDLFLHGIGGGKYDQLGDEICTAFFGVKPLRFMVISATVQLPGFVPDDHDQKIRRLRRSLRDIVYQPERFADRVDLDPDLLARKVELISAVDVALDKKLWHREVESINAKLSKQLVSMRSQLQAELVQVERSAAAQRLMASREHPFCIFPIDYLQRTFSKLLA
ncbi:hypothetical protein K227x_53040 [Rubripirellula lacrimiformis]|uniref:Uncharacterized protein n=1 Tax=Rubripirellula lacrimiformis TaxID=1930273 RepID=A0A517NIC7_9BACT|nr:hypothetical protein [Rubripirellula lacrimiformis]QDT06882.1 hypothetical protein K227x_53040 [Rubripirellula lacrimiformis]